MVIVAVALGYKNFEHEKLENARFECLECKYIYNPKYGNEKLELNQEHHLRNYQIIGFVQFVANLKICLKYIIKKEEEKCKIK